MREPSRTVSFPPLLLPASPLLSVELDAARPREATLEEPPYARMS